MEPNFKRLYLDGKQIRLHINNKTYNSLKQESKKTGYPLLVVAGLRLSQYNKK